MTDEINKDEAVTRLNNEYAGFEVSKLFDKGVITILSTSQWYLIMTISIVTGIKSNGKRRWKNAFE